MRLKTPSTRFFRQMYYKYNIQK